MDLIRKGRLDMEYKLQDVHAKNVTVDCFAFPMTVAGLAMVFKLTADMKQAGVRRQARLCVLRAVKAVCCAGICCCVC